MLLTRLVSIVWLKSQTGEHLTTLSGHTDFIKSLLILPGGHLLSTSSDRSIKVWQTSVTDIGIEADCVQTIKEHTRPVDKSEIGLENDQILVWTADSMGTIKQWTFRDGRLQDGRNIPGHETSVTDLVHTDEGVWSGKLLIRGRADPVVSMDRTAILHADSRNTFQHSSSLHCIVSIPPEMTNRSLVVTGGEDEDLIVWENRGEGFAPISKVEAHSHVVSSIRVWQPEGKAGLILSGSLDGTIRRWTLQGTPYVDSL